MCKQKSVYFDYIQFTYSIVDYGHVVSVSHSLSLFRTNPTLFCWHSIGSCKRCKFNFKMDEAHTAALLTKNIRKCVDVVEWKDKFYESQSVSESKKHSHTQIRYRAQICGCYVFLTCFCLHVSLSLRAIRVAVCTFIFTNFFSNEKKRESVCDRKKIEWIEINCKLRWKGFSAQTDQLKLDYCRNLFLLSSSSVLCLVNVYSCWMKTSNA